MKSHSLEISVHNSTNYVHHLDHMLPFSPTQKLNGHFHHSVSNSLARKGKMVGVDEAQIDKMLFHFFSYLPHVGVFHEAVEHFPNPPRVRPHHHLPPSLHDHDNLGGHSVMVQNS